MNTTTKTKFSAFIFSHSLMPYVYLLAFSISLLLLGIVFNSSDIGVLYGKSIGGIDPKTSPAFFWGLVLIFFSLRHAPIVITSTIIFACLHQIYLSEFTDFRQKMDLPPLDYFSFSRIYGGLIFISCLGSLLFLIKKCIPGNPTSNNSVRTFLLFLCFLLSTLTAGSKLTRAESTRMMFECTIDKLTPVQHWYVSCERDTYIGHVTMLNQLISGDRYWSGFVYRVDRDPSAFPFINLLIPPSISPDGISPPQKVRCGWANEAKTIMHCR